MEPAALAASRINAVLINTSIGAPTNPRARGVEGVLTLSAGAIRAHRGEVASTPVVPVVPVVVPADDPATAAGDPAPALGEAEVAAPGGVVPR
jgi:hypothetical protein